MYKQYHHFKSITYEMNEFTIMTFVYNIIIIYKEKLSSGISKKALIILMRLDE